MNNNLLPGVHCKRKRDNYRYMVFSISGTLKKRIAFVMAVLLTAVFCGSTDLSCDYFEPAGVLKGDSSVSIAHSLEAFPASSACEESNRDSSDPHNLEKRYVTSDMFLRIIRKFLVILGCGRIPTSFTYLKHSCLSICISGCAFLFLLTHIRFIHLKDGCK